MTKQNSHEDSFAFLSEEHRTASENTWHYARYTWDVFRFYITLVTASGALIVALFTPGRELTFLPLSISLICGVLFLIGMPVFVQLIHLDLQLRRTVRRLDHVRDILSSRSDLRDYLSYLRSASMDVTTRQDLGYSLSDQLTRAVRGGGLKTQTVLINSMIGTLSIAGMLTAFKELDQPPLLILLPAYLLLLLLHSLVARLLTRNSPER